MTGRRIVIERPHLLLVEGRDDKAFFEALLRHEVEDPLRDRVQIIPYEGAANLRNFLRALVATPRFSQVAARIGIVQDADRDPTAALQRVQGALKAAGLPCPVDVHTLAGPVPQVVVAVLPAMGEPGTLENLCLEAVRDDPAMACVEEYLDCLRRSAVTLPRNVPKAKVHAFLASRARPGLRLGEAAMAGYWPWNHPAFEDVKRFIRMVATGSA